VCDTGVEGGTGVWRESKVIRLLSIIHNGIILDLACGFGGSVGEDVRAGFPSVGVKTSGLYPSRADMRSGDSDLDSPKVQ